jgi:hypothetical protein
MKLKSTRMIIMNLEIFDKKFRIFGQVEILK